MIRFKIFFCFLYRLFKWLVQAVVILLKSTTKSYHKIIFDEPSIIMVPHSDDEWIGCSSIISNNKNVSCVYFDFTGRVNKSDTAPTRLSELQELQRKFKFNLYQIKSHDEVFEINNIINKIKPQSIFLPSFIDWHPEHINVVEVLYEVLKNMEQNNAVHGLRLYMYQISVPHPFKNIYYLPLTYKEHWNKWKVFRTVYISQKNIPILRFAINEFISARIGNVNSFACETYVLTSIEQLSPINSSSYNDQLNENDINNLIKIRRMSQSMLDNII